MNFKVKIKIYIHLVDVYRTKKIQKWVMSPPWV
jgi:hypothetical protein